jgi:amino acid permease
VTFSVELFKLTCSLIVIFLVKYVRHTRRAHVREIVIAVRKSAAALLLLLLTFQLVSLLSRAQPP